MCGSQALSSKLGHFVSCHLTRFIFGPISCNISSAGSLVAITGMPLTAIFTRDNPLRVCRAARQLLAFDNRVPHDSLKRTYSS